MLVVPGYKQQYAYENPGQSFGPKLQSMQVGSSAEMFGGAAGRTLERAGYALQRSAHEMAHIYDDDQSTRVREKAVQMQRDFLNWQSGMKQKAGRDGMSAADDYDSWAEEQLRTLRQDLAPEERDVFADLMVKRLNAQRSWANKHALAQNSVYKESVWDEEISAGRELVAANMDEEELVDVALEQIKDAVFTQGKHSGFTDADIMNLTSENVSTALALPMVKWIQEGDRETALSYMKKYHDQLSPTAKHYLATLLEQGNAEANTDTANAAHEAAPQAALSAPQTSQATQPIQAPTAAEGNDAEQQQMTIAKENQKDAKVEGSLDPLDGQLWAAANSTASDAGSAPSSSNPMATSEELDPLPKLKNYSPGDVTILSKYFTEGRPALERAAKVTGVPLKVILAFAIMESDIGAKKTINKFTTVPKDSDRNKGPKGMMQVSNSTAKDVRKETLGYDPNLEKQMVREGADLSIYYGALRIRQFAQQHKVNLEDLSEKEFARLAYQYYFMGPKGSRNFWKLAPEDSVLQYEKISGKAGIREETVTGNAEFFRQLGKGFKGPATSRAETERRLDMRIVPALKVAQQLLDN